MNQTLAENGNPNKEREMRKLSDNPVCSLFVFLFFALQLLIVPTEASAAWRKSSVPEEDNTWTNIALGAAAVCVIAAAVIHFTKSDSEEKKEAKPPSETNEAEGQDASESSSLLRNDSHSELCTELAKPAKGESGLGIFFDVGTIGQSARREANAPGLADLAVKAGFSIDF